MTSTELETTNVTVMKNNLLEMSNLNNRTPTVFISYSWDDKEHRQWVEDLAKRLLDDGIDTRIDRYELKPGDRLPEFMEKQISCADYVLIICTPKYKEKADTRTGGVGYESHIISGELLAKGHERKFIPVLRKGTICTAIPKFLSGKLAIDLSGNPYNEYFYLDLLTTLFGSFTKPKIGFKPSSIDATSKETTHEAITEPNQPIRILGIITDEVTVPTMDGSRGSALYKIPFKLSKQPSDIWKSLFVQSWDSPPSFSTMHRPGIASVHGDRIILDGTTIEEVQKNHRDTLKLCVEEANRKEQAFLEKKKQAIEAERIRRMKHFDNVNELTHRITF